MAAVSAARDRFALHLLQFGAIAVVLAATPYKLFDLDRYFVPKELVLHLVALFAGLLIVTNRRRLSLGVVDVLLTAFIAESVVSATLATNIWVAQRSLAISISGVVLFWCASSLRRAGLVRPLLVALALGVVVCAGTSLAQAYGIQTEYFSLNRAPGGTLGNRNFIAHMCALGAPVVALVALTARRGFGSIFGGIGMAVLAGTLVMSLPSTDIFTPCPLGLTRRHVRYTDITSREPSGRGDLDLPEARVGDRVGAEAHEAGGHGAQQERPVGGLPQVGECAVEGDRLVGVVVERRLDQEVADQREHDHPSEISSDAESREPLSHAVAHLAGLRILEELLFEGLVALLETDADDDRAGDHHQPCAAGPAQHATRRLVGVRPATAPS